MEIKFKERIRGIVKERQWRGSKKAAIEAAIDWLMVEYRPYVRGWVYYDHKTGEEFVFHKDALVVAGAAILAGAKNWLSLWCAEYGAPLKKKIKL